MRGPVYISLLATVAILCVVLASLGLHSVFRSPLRADSVVGSWTSSYHDGRVDLDLMADGNFRERVSGVNSGSGSLADKDQAGTWSIKNDKVVLENVLAVAPVPGKSPPVSWVYVSGRTWELHALHGVLGTSAKPTSLVVEESVWFQRIDKKGTK